MEHSTVDQTHKARFDGGRRRLRRPANARMVGIAVAWVGIAAIAATYILAERVAPTREPDCLRKEAADPHILFEAFFQNAAEQGALDQMARICRK